MPTEKIHLPRTAIVSAGHATKRKEALTESEKRLESDKDEHAEEEFEKLTKVSNETADATIEFDGRSLNDLLKSANRISNLVDTLLKQYRQALAAFRKAIREKKAHQACIQSRRLRIALECLAAIHPDLIRDFVGKAAGTLKEGYIALSSEKISRGDYLRNILTRHVYLKVAELVLDESSIDPENFANAYDKQAKAYQAKITGLKVTTTRKLESLAEREGAYLKRVRSLERELAEVRAESLGLEI